LTAPSPSARVWHVRCRSPNVMALIGVCKHQHMQPATATAPQARYQVECKQPRMNHCAIAALAMLRGALAAVDAARPSEPVRRHVNIQEQCVLRYKAWISSPYKGPSLYDVSATTITYATILHCCSGPGPCDPPPYPYLAVKFRYGNRSPFVNHRLVSCAPFGSSCPRSFLPNLTSSCRRISTKHSLRSAAFPRTACFNGTTFVYLLCQVYSSFVSSAL
jgi:hypothetical protein